MKTRVEMCRDYVGIRISDPSQFQSNFRDVKLNVN